MLRRFALGRLRFGLGFLQTLTRDGTIAYTLGWSSGCRQRRARHGIIIGMDAKESVPQWDNGCARRMVQK
jgi:hypothetical protein